MSLTPINDLGHLPLNGQFQDLLRAVGDRVLKQYAEIEQGVVYKSDDSPQTVADRESHLRICEFLDKHSPFPVFSEEALPEAGWSADKFWTVDPLDGTQDFIRKTGEFSVMLALIENGHPVFGVVYQPATGRTYAAETGRGAYLIEPDGSASRLHVSSDARLQAIRMVVSRTHPQKTDALVAAALGTTTMVPHGSFGLKVGLIARGDAELLLYPPQVTSIWDSAPNVVILAEAGGRMTDLDGKELLVDPRSPRNRRGIIATNGLVHDQILDIVRGVLQASTSS